MGRAAELGQLQRLMQANVQRMSCVQVALRGVGDAAGPGCRGSQSGAVPRGCSLKVED